MIFREREAISAAEGERGGAIRKSNLSFPKISILRFKNITVESDDFSGPALKLQWQLSGLGLPLIYR
jgi:hypothetical protein